MYHLHIIKGVLAVTVQFNNRGWRFLKNTHVFRQPFQDRFSLEALVDFFDAYTDRLFPVKILAYLFNADSNGLLRVVYTHKVVDIDRTRVLVTMVKLTTDERSCMYRQHEGDKVNEIGRLTSNKS